MLFLACHTALPNFTARTFRRGFASARALSREYENLKVSRPKPNVTLLTLNRPKALNALSSPLFEEFNDVLDQTEKDDQVGVLVVTGSEKAFAGGRVVWM